MSNDGLRPKLEMSNEVRGAEHKQNNKGRYKRLLMRVIINNK